MWEQLRPSFEFHLLRNARSALFSAPLTTPQRILDLGCGSGHWMAAMAAKFPATALYGVDRVKRLVTLDPNTCFIQANILDPLPFADATMDYIHVQFMAPSIPIDHWFFVLRESLRVLRPKGWLEIIELGLPHISHPIIWIWIAKLGRHYGYELFPGKALTLWLAHIGGVNVVSREERIIRGTNPDTSSRLMIRDGIALAELFRDEVVTQGVTTPLAYHHELQVMKQNLFRTGREDAISIYATRCQRTFQEHASSS